MIEAVGNYAIAESVQGNVASSPVQSKGFADWIAQELTRTSGAINEADMNVKKLAAGEPVSLHEVMLSLEEARLQFQLVTQVRNRVLDAYQDLLRMQI